MRLPRLAGLLLQGLILGTLLYLALIQFILVNDSVRIFRYVEF